MCGPVLRELAGATLVEHRDLRAQIPRGDRTRGQLCGERPDVLREWAILGMQLPPHHEQPRAARVGLQEATVALVQYRYVRDGDSLRRGVRHVVAQRIALRAALELTHA